MAIFGNMGFTQHQAIVRVTLAVVASCVIGCRGSIELTPSPAESCRIGGELERQHDTVRIAISRPANPGAGLLNDDARLVHRQMYESLVTVDCQGMLSAGLASIWESHQGGREWRFMLRPGAVYWDDVPVSIMDVIDSWERNWSTVESLLPPGDYFNVADAIANDGVVVRLEQPDSMFPFYVAGAEFAVTRPGAVATDWPIGTGPYRPAHEARLNDGSLLLHSPVMLRPTLFFKPVGIIDTRDVLDAGFDVVLGRGRDAVDYVRRRGDYVDFPLGWNLMYALVVQQSRFGPPDDTQDDRVNLVRTEIARDAVRADARPSRCTVFKGSAPPTTEGNASGDQIAHDVSNTTARSIAERLLAVTNDPVTANAMGLVGVSRVVPVEKDDLVARVTSGDVVAAIVPYRSVANCHTAMEVWKRYNGLLIMPLIDTRSHLFTKDGKVRATVGGDGIPLLFPNRVQ